MRVTSRKYSKTNRTSISEKIRGLIPLLCLITGIISGVIQAKGIEPERLKAIEDVLIQGLGNTQNFSEVFTGNVIKNGGYMLVIWLTAFIPMGYFAAGFILFIRAMGYGFTAVAFISVFNKTGLLYTISLSLQGIILLAAAYLLCVWGIRFGDVFKNRRVSISWRQIISYILALLIAETSVILASIL